MAEHPWDTFESILPWRQSPPETITGPAGMSEIDDLGVMKGVQSAKDSEKSGAPQRYKKLHDDLNRPPAETVTPAGRLRRYAKQARASTIKTPPSDAIQLHRMVQKLRHRGQAYAPIRAQQSAPAGQAANIVMQAESELGKTVTGRKNLFSELTAHRRSSPLSPQSNRRLINSLADGLAAAKSSSAASKRAGAGLRSILQAAHSSAGTGFAPLIRAAIAIGAQAGQTNRLSTSAITMARTRSSPSGAAAVTTLRHLANPQSRSFAPRPANMPAGAMATAQRATEDAANPLRHATPPVQTPDRQAPRAPGRATTQNAPSTPETLQQTAALQRDIAASIQNFWAQQARRPPNGTSAFDPLISPAWAGTQMPG